MADRFSGILSKTYDAVERPKPVPMGTYRAVIAKVPDVNPQDDTTSRISFPLRLVEAQDNVDMEGYNGNPIGKTVNQTFFLHDAGDEEETRRDVYRIHRFLENFGVEVTGKTLSQAFGESVNAEGYVTLGHRAGKDGLEYPEVRSTSSNYPEQ